MDWLHRRDASLPFQEWRPFPRGTMVEVENAFGGSRVGRVEEFWWGYEQELGAVSESVIMRARRAFLLQTPENWQTEGEW